MNGSDGLASRDDAPQKPNYRSSVQGLERQGLRKHLPSRSSVRAELRDGNLRDGNTFFLLRNYVLSYSLSFYQRDQSLLFIFVAGVERRRRRDSQLAAEEMSI